MKIYFDAQSITNENEETVYNFYLNPVIPSEYMWLDPKKIEVFGDILVVLTEYKVDLIERAT